MVTEGLWEFWENYLEGKNHGKNREVSVFASVIRGKVGSPPKYREVISAFSALYWNFEWIYNKPSVIINKRKCIA